MTNFLLVGVLLGAITYISWMGYWWLYLPGKYRNWFSKSMGRLFILDIAITVGAALFFGAVSGSLIALIAAATLGMLGTLTAIGIRCCYLLKEFCKNRKSTNKEIQ